MKLVVGLGNPDARYAETRHNVGFVVVDTLADRWRWSFARGKFDDLEARGEQYGETIVLVKPQTYMNGSGETVGPMARYFKVDPSDVLVVYDDIDLPMGVLRLREKGSAGTHNGMRSVVQHLGTTQFPRLRVGIGKAGRQSSLTGHVLGKFSADERPLAKEAVGKAADCVEQVLRGHWQDAMNTYNQRPARRTASEESSS